MVSILSPIRNNAFARTVDHTVGSAVLYAFGTLRRRRPVPRRIARVGIMMFETIGDTLLAAGLIASLRKANPNVHLVVFASQGNLGVIPLLVGIHSVVQVPLTRPIRAITAIRSVDVDVMIDIGQWPRWYALLCALSSSRHTIGFATPGQHRHYAYDSAVSHLNDVHEMENFLRLMVPLHGVTPAAPAAVLRAVGKPPQECAAAVPYVVFHPWASGFNFVFREWPMSYWRDLADRISATGRTVLVTGSVADAARANAWVDSCGGLSVKCIAGERTLTEVAAILAHADAVVSVNTGIMHLAALLDVPLIALHGPTSRRRWGPVGTRSIALAPPIGPHAEFLNLGFEYPPEPVEVMSQIDVDTVFNAVLDQLAGAQTGARARQND